MEVLMQRDQCFRQAGTPAKPVAIARADGSEGNFRFHVKFITILFLPPKQIG
jgi:hypothetical protein